MTAQHVLAIYQGTTGTKAVVVLAAADGTVAGNSGTEFRQHYPWLAGWVEHDSEEIWRSVLVTVEQALRDAWVRPGELARIGITSRRASPASGHHRPAGLRRSHPDSLVPGAIRAAPI